MDDLGEDDISDTQFNEICENVLTQRELREFSMEWSESVEEDKKRKLCDSECPIPQKVKVIEPHPQFGVGNNTEASNIFRPWEGMNQDMENNTNIFRPWEGMNQGIENNTNQFGAGRVEPEKEKNPQPENEELPEQNHEHERDSHEVEPEKEKNPQPETAKEQGEETISFKDRLFTILYEPENARDIQKTGEKYKPKIKGKVKEYMDRNITFHLRYKVRLVKVDIEGEEERVVQHFNSGNRRLLDMEEFDEVYGGHMDKLNDELENYTGEGSEWVLDEISSIYLNIARL